MGVQLKNVPVKLDEETISRIDEDVRRFAPFCSGRSSMLRALVYVAYGQIDAGKVKLTLTGIQRAIALRQKPKREMLDPELRGAR